MNINEAKRKSICLLVIILAVLTASVGWAHEGDTHVEDQQETSGRVLGTISFPTTTKSPEAQQAFIRGMLLLHLFEYPFAREEFRSAQEIDPDFAMAYWGEAMTYNHPIWDQQDQHAARAVLAALGATTEDRLSKTPAAREQGFLLALDALYGEGSKAGRDRAYARVMEQMAAQFPEDHEVQLFYALSLFGVQAGVRDVPTYMMATAIADAVFAENPQHPGAAHYLIHGVDDPIHAVLGLRAARALAVMAPDAGHSQHMTSHIFTALGMWDDVVMANEAAIRVQNQMRVEMGLPARHWGHYNFWLLYGLLQQGNHGGAKELLEAAYAEALADGKAPEDPMILDPDRSLVGSVVQMWVRYLVETGDWDGDIAGWSFNLGDAFDPNLNFSFVQAMRAARAGQVAQTSQYVEQFRELKQQLANIIGRQEEKAPSDLLFLDRLAVIEQELMAAIEMARGDKIAAVRFAGQASSLEAEMPFSFGPPFVDMPSADFLGELLLDARKYADAAAAFETQLERTKLRTSSLLGLSRAQAKLGKDAESRYAIQKLNLLWHDADPEVRAAIPSPDTSP
jgi:hypothetical protein